MRKVTWDELFMDLVYVAVFSRLGLIIKDFSITGTDINWYILAFYPVWATWNQIQMILTRFGADSFTSRNLIRINLILVAGMGIYALDVGSEDPLINTANEFIGIFLIHRLLILLHAVLAAYWMPPLLVPSFIPFQAITFIASIPWFVSIVVDAQYRSALWWLAFALEFGLRFIALAAMRYLVKNPNFILVNIEHETERYSLLTLVVIGEMVVGFLWSGNGRNNTLDLTLVPTLFGILITMSFQWLYFNVDR